MASLFKADSQTTEKQAMMFKLVQALIRMRESSLMKPDKPIYRIVEVPLLMQNHTSLLHADDYLKENVEISTFTHQNDVLLKLRDRFLAFDIHGNQLKVQISEDIIREKYLTDFKVI